MELNEISGQIVDSAVEVHRELGGPGLLECVYEEAFVAELEERGFKVERQRRFPVEYKGRRLSTNIRVDLIVQESVIVECKAVSVTDPLFEAQVLTYLRLLDLRLGLVINFGKRRVIDGVRRVVNAL